MSNYCNGTCPMYDAENGECCATDGPRVSVTPDAECFFDAYERDNPFVPPKPTNADRIRSMNDEELARFLWEQNGGNRYWKSVEKYLDWLQKEVTNER